MFREDLLDGKRILVTGGGTGLGRAMGRRFLELGANLIICGRRADVLAETAKALAEDTGGAIETHACDIRDAAAVEAMVAAIWGGGPLDHLVNNAAGNFIARTETLLPRAVDAVVNIVLHGTAYATLACGRRWLAERCAASVLSIVTTYAWTGSGYVVPSAMAKAGVLAMTRSLAVEWGDRGVRLNAIAPGPFPTPGASKRLVPRPDPGPRLRRQRAPGPRRRAHRAGQLGVLPAGRRGRLYQRRGGHHRRRPVAQGRRPVQFPLAPRRRRLGRNPAQEARLSIPGFVVT